MNEIDQKHCLLSSCNNNFGVMVNDEKSKFETILQKQNTTVQVILIDICFNSFRTKTPVILLLHKNPQK